MIQGTHGTYKSYKNKILTYGFRKPYKPGQYGTAIYFWRDNTYEYELAVAWLRQKADKRRIPVDKLGVVFFADFDFNVDGDEFIDLDYDVTSQFEKFSIERKIPLQSAYDLYLEDIEKKTGVPIVALQGICNPPGKKYFNGLNVKESNFAYTVIIKDPKCIKIVKSKTREFTI